MGMASGDNDWNLIEDHELLKWAKDFPKSSFGYDYTPTEDERALHEESIKKHIQKKPRTRNPYEGDKR